VHPVRFPLALRIVPWIALSAFIASPVLAFTPSGLLEIHQINVQQGDCTLIIGPDGTTILVDGGDATKGTNEVVPYLQGLGLLPVDGLDYMIATHYDSDHLGGLDEVINAGYDVRDGIWDNGSGETGTQVTQFKNAAATTTAAPLNDATLGAIVSLGNGAVARIVAVGGSVLGHGVVPSATNNENDTSVAILVQYGGFDYLTGGDLGGGQWSVDNNCTGRTTGQVNVETPLAVSLMPGGGASLLTADGVEVLDVNHHGSESSTNHQYMNLLSPAVAVINVGSGQGSTYHHPRIDVVENVLMAGVSCITVPPAMVLQTEEGAPVGANTSFAGYCSGDIVITTSGVASYTVQASGQVSQGPDERAAAGIVTPAVFPFDGDVVPDTEPPLVAVSAPNGGEDWLEGTVHNITWSATDNVGVTSVDILYSVTGSSGSYATVAAGEANDGLFAWTVPNTPTSNGFVKVLARDAAENTAEDVSNGAFTISGAPVQALHVHGLTVQNISSGGGRWNGRATITVHDQNHTPVSGVTVTGNWSGTVVQNGVTGVTSGSGVVVIDSQKKKNATGLFCFDVTGLTSSGYTYDFAADVPLTPPAICGPQLPQAFAVANLLIGGSNSSEARIELELEEPAFVSITLFDLAGRIVGRPADARFSSGRHEVSWSVADYPSGIYFIRMATDAETVTRKFIIAR
jgi:beta-lactamase superfamily II metal-dependent hydrolase